MLSKNREGESLETSEAILAMTSDLVEVEEVHFGASLTTPTQFYGHYQDFFFSCVLRNIGVDIIMARLVKS